MTIAAIDSKYLEELLAGIKEAKVVEHPQDLVLSCWGHLPECEERVWVA
jgi:hypothetical protein